MSGYQMCFMVLVAILALAAIVMIVINGGLNPDNKCTRNDTVTFGEYDVHPNGSTSSELRARIATLQKKIEESNKRRETLEKQLRILHNGTRKSWMEECKQSLNAECEAAMKDCERGRIAAAEELRKRALELGSNMTRLNEQLQLQRNESSSNINRTLSELRSCINNNQLLTNEKTALQSANLNLRSNYDLCTNTSVQLQAAISSLDDQLDNVDDKLVNCSKISLDLRNSHEDIIQELLNMNSSFNNCSIDKAEIYNKLEIANVTNLQLKENCAVKNNTKTLSASVVKYIERCQQRVRNVSLIRLPSGEYLFSPSQVNWFAAVTRCQSLGLQLVSIESSSENEALVREARRITKNETNHRFWMSGSDLGTEGNFTWMSTGGQLTYKAWHANEPNNAWGGEHCMQMWNRRGYYGWNDSKCTSLAGYICEVPFVCRT